MSRQIIQLGVTSNDGEGEPLRLGGSKINQNFAETYSNLGDGTTLPVASAFVQTTWSASTSAAFRTAIGAGTGTGSVVSVAMTVPSLLNLAGSPITDSGTFVVTLAATASNLVFAGPTSGASASPAFRSLTSADLPTNLSGYTASGGTFSGPILVNPTISGGTHSGGSFSGVTLISPTISGGTASGLTLSGGSASAITLNAPTVSGGTFSGGTFTGPTLVNATISGGTHSGGTFSGITIIASTFSGGTVSGTTISGGTASGTSLTGPTVSGGTFSGGTFSGITITGPTVSGGTYSGGTFSSATINTSTMSGGTAVGLTSLESDVISVKDQSLSSFRLTIINSGGTLQHKITALDSATAATFANKVTGASATLANTPTGADSSTAFASGGKLGNPTAGFVFNTAAQIIADLPWTAHLDYNDSGTALTCLPFVASRDVNGTTRIRPEIRFFDAASGATFGVTTGTLTSGKQLNITILGFWA